MFALPSTKNLRRIVTNISPNIQPFANDRNVLFVKVCHICRGHKVKQFCSYTCSHNLRQVRKTSCFFSTKQDFSSEERDEQRFYINTFVDGPPLTFGFGKIAVQTDSSVVGAAGSTIVLATVAKDERFNSEKTASTLLTVGYRQRLASVGRIPVGNSRVDNTGRMTVDEVLASRAIDRAIRPLLLKNKSNFRYHVQCSVESCELWQDEYIENESFVAKNKTYGNPVSTALNTAAAAMAEYLSEPVAATSLAIFSKGLVVQDAGPNTLFEATKHGEHELIGQLLYAGTRHDAVMIEWTAAPYSGPNGLPEHHWQDFLELAAASIQPRLDTIEELSSLRRSSSLKLSIDQKGSTLGYDEKVNNVREKLKLSPSPSSQSSPRSEPISLKFPSPDTVIDALLPLIIRHCESLLSQPLALLFGYNDTTSSQNDESLKDLSTAFVHPFLDLLSKAERGLREHVIKQEIEHVINQFLSSDNDGEITEYKLGWKLLSDDRRNEVVEAVVNTLFRRALISTAIKYGVRSDGRGLTKYEGWKTIRPVRLQAPALPDNVHGSALFSRGETQVLCTVTLGPPSEGRRNLDPFRQTSNPKLPPEPNASTGQAYNDIPVGSLRFLRSQEALVSDLNTRKVKAEKEMTGDSGSLAEFETAFLQYDFPPHSTGSVPEGGSSRMTADRRSIGHGALAERAILPVLPKKHAFPYTIRMTSDVTDSNGSSSMASVCGATLALLDAGVPIAAPVVGVSVGLAMDTNDKEAKNQPYTLLLDITGTEDHVGIFVTTKAIFACLLENLLTTSRILSRIFISFASLDQWISRSLVHATE